MSLTSASAMQVYIRLLVLVDSRGRAMKVRNSELHPVARTALRALTDLREAKLVEVDKDPVDFSRTVRVL